MEAIANTNFWTDNGIRGHGNTDVVAATTSVIIGLEMAFGMLMGLRQEPDYGTKRGTVNTETSAGTTRRGSWDFGCTGRRNVGLGYEVIMPVGRQSNSDDETREPLGR